METGADQYSVMVDRWVELGVAVAAQASNGVFWTRSELLKYDDEGEVSGLGEWQQQYRIPRTLWPNPNYPHSPKAIFMKCVDGIWIIQCHDWTYLTSSFGEEEEDWAVLQYGSSSETSVRQTQLKTWLPDSTTEVDEFSYTGAMHTSYFAAAYKTYNGAPESIFFDKTTGTGRDAIRNVRWVTVESFTTAHGSKVGPFADQVAFGGKLTLCGGTSLSEVFNQLKGTPSGADYSVEPNYGASPYLSTYGGSWVTYYVKSLNTYVIFMNSTYGSITAPDDLTPGTNKTDWPGAYFILIKDGEARSVSCVFFDKYAIPGAGAYGFWGHTTTSLVGEKIRVGFAHARPNPAGGTPLSYAATYERSIAELWEGNRDYWEVTEMRAIDSSWFLYGSPYISDMIASGADCVSPPGYTGHYGEQAYDFLPDDPEFGRVVLHNNGSFSVEGRGPYNPDQTITYGVSTGIYGYYVYYADEENAGRCIHILTVGVLKVINIGESDGNVVITEQADTIDAAFSGPVFCLGTNVNQSRNSILLGFVPVQEKQT